MDFREPSAKRIQPDHNVVMKARYADIIGFTVATRIAIIQDAAWEHGDIQDRIYELDAVPSSTH